MTDDAPGPPVEGAEDDRHWWGLGVVLIVWAALMLGLTGWGFGEIVAAGGFRTRDCRAPEEAVSQAAPPPAQEVVSLEPRAEPHTTVPFQMDRTVQTREVEYDVTGGTITGDSRLRVLVGQFLRSDSQSELCRASIEASARVVGSQVFLVVAFDRTDPAFGRPGTYLGTVSIVDPRVSRVDVPFNVTLAFPYWQFVVAIFLFSLLPATGYVWFLRGSFTSHSKMDLRDMQTWLFTRTTMMALGAGFAAAFSLFTAVYLKTGDWGVDLTAFSALFGGSFSAFVAAATGVTAAAADRVSARAAQESAAERMNTEAEPGAQGGG